MSLPLSELIDRFRGLEILVIGEAMLDSYLEGTTGRLCREAPVPIVALDGRHDAPGGAANTAVNSAALGARVRFLSVVGDDCEGDLLLRSLAGLGIDTADVLVEAGRRTLAKHRVVAASQLLVRFDQGDTGPLDSETERALIDRLIDLFPSCDAVIISDYGYGVLAPAVVETLTALQRRSPRVLVVDSKNLASYREVGPTAVKPNYEEAVQLLGGWRGGGSSRVEAISDRGESLLDQTGARMAAVTLDAEGAIVIDRGRPPYRTYAKPARHSQAAGAGDTFLAALGLALAAGAETPAAADLASAAGAVVVAREGTVSCSARDLRDQLAVEAKPATDASALAARLDEHRRLGRRIVFTNGCFDILHRGHVSYLSRAKALGDVLVVGVNSDDSIRRLKGPSRPINALEDRVQLLAALSCVDHIVPFGEDTPGDLILRVRPDVFVKGGDYTRERLPEAAIVEGYGGEVQILPFVADHSTTDIIERIRAVYGLAGKGVHSPRFDEFAPADGVADVRGGFA
ncbi:D-glycero-beta-D-manno-heptose 1-phosphate adenylyltransferase [Tautonia plasticadhaerens]|uniref:Bifunctional protein HldE n=1 Tax=Tautonia plasticadhaerens TaxID=2527974 RepID=A0A518H616_9BACT|nr:D-glycero-beta-D-manno-heptose 1-phosphate adenylyltransferase [Tautonia plasticadhaerens]QDV36270.1 Bifunctional protein HldE [Tautonia plasticadhaerens]